MTNIYQAINTILKLITLIPLPNPLPIYVPFPFLSLGQQLEIFQCMKDILLFQKVCQRKSFAFVAQSALSSSSNLK